MRAAVTTDSAVSLLLLTAARQASRFGGRDIIRGHNLGGVNRLGGIGKLAQLPIAVSVFAILKNVRAPQTSGLLLNGESQLSKREGQNAAQKVNCSCIEENERIDFCGPILRGHISFVIILNCGGR